MVSGYTWSLRRGDLDESHQLRHAFRGLFPSDAACPMESELVLGELVSNAVRHGETPITVSVSFDDDTLSICVKNGGHGFTLADRLSQSPQSMDIGGRGLHIVHALAESLTVTVTEPNECCVIATMKLRDAVHSSLRAERIARPAGSLEHGLRSGSFPVR